jgi:hypothetical protein
MGFLFTLRFWFTFSVSEDLKLDIFIFVVNIVLLGVPEYLVCAELFLDHSLENSVVRELLIKFLQNFSFFPFIFRLRKIFQVLRVKLFFLLFSSLVLLQPLQPHSFNLFRLDSLCVYLFEIQSPILVDHANPFLILRHLSVVQCIG